MRLIARTVLGSSCLVLAACSSAPPAPSADDAEGAVSQYLAGRAICAGTYELRRVKVHRIAAWDGGEKGFPVKYGYEAFCDAPYPTTFGGLDNRLDLWLRQDEEGRWTAFLPEALQAMADKFDAQLRSELQRAVDESFE